jgi:hypothetical protein
MQFSIVYNVSGEELLARIPGDVHCHTDIADVTMRRESDGSFRLIVAPKGEALPEPQAQANRFAANAAVAIQSSEEHIAILARSSIVLRGSSTELRCSVVAEEIDAAMKRAVEHAVGMIVGKAFASRGVDLSQAVRRIETRLQT